MQSEQIESLSIVYFKLFEDAKKILSLISEDIVEPIIFMNDNSLHIHWHFGKLPAIFISLGIFSFDGSYRVDYSCEFELNRWNSIGGSFNDIEEISDQLIYLLNKHFKKEEYINV